MCGINGFVSFINSDDFSVDEKLKEMNNLITHRGPDQDGFFIERTSEYTVGMAMRRLSIIDLHLGQQPIFTKDKQKVIVYNGEIYNHKILKKNLEQKGVVFNTNSDTEVILKLYEQYGVNAFSMLDGMFAFSIYDKTINKIFIARDFFGEKPLYFTKTANQFIWASELKSILKIVPEKPPIDSIGLSLYFQLTYIPAPYTIFESISKLEANNFIEFNCSTFSFQVHEISHEFKKYNIDSKSDAIHLTRNLVRESVYSRSISDVPLGSFLSGGVDSSIITLCLAQQFQSKIDTFSIGFENKLFDESNKARTIAKLVNSNHHEFIISEKDLTANFDEILLNFDEPFADSSALASFLLSKKTKETVKVALTGDGGDETFGGYNKYYMGNLNNRYTKLIPENLHENIQKFMKLFLNSTHDERGIKFKLKRLLSSIDYKGDFYFKIISLGFQEHELKKIIKNTHYASDSMFYYKKKTQGFNKSLTDHRNIDKLISLEGDMLVKVDRTSMLNSLECRAPFLNKEIWNFTNQLPENYLINGSDKKHILKKAFEKDFPNGFLNNSKKGFAVPVGDWLRNSLRLELSSYIDSEFLLQQNIFNLNEIQNLVNLHISGQIDNSFKIWTFFCFQKWHKNNY